MLGDLLVVSGWSRALASIMLTWTCCDHSGTLISKYLSPNEETEVDFE